MDGFRPVLRNKRKKKKDNKGDLERIRKLLADIKDDLCRTEFYKELCELMSKTSDKACTMEVDIVCLGLGNFMESYIARYQLALLLALRQDLHVPIGECEIYDPLFTSEEIAFLSQLQFSVCSQNEEGKKKCRDGIVTLFYLPHCGKALYNNILWANWGPKLKNIFILGNSFSAMVERTPKRMLEKTANYVIKIHPYTQEQPLSIPAQYEDVFNDTSLHSFLSHDQQEVLHELWEDNNEPVYDKDDAEIIFSNNDRSDLT